MAAFFAVLPGLWISYLGLWKVWSTVTLLRRGEVEYPEDPFDLESGGSIRTDLHVSISVLCVGVAVLVLGVLGFLYTD